MSTTTVDMLAIHSLVQGAGVAAIAATLVTLSIFLKSLVDFTRTGPQMTGEVLSHYRLYLAYSLGRLVFFAFLITGFMAFLGVVVYVVGLALTGAPYRASGAVIAALLSILILTGRQFARTLLHSPGVIAASSLYSSAHFLPIWERLTVGRLKAFDVGLFSLLGIWVAAGLAMLAKEGAWMASGSLWGIAAFYVLVPYFAKHREPSPVRAGRRRPPTPNILMIGADTLRADRVNGNGYRRNLTPNLERFAERATHFMDCYVPCARTAPSIVSMLTGTWPHTHGVRDTFVTPEETRLPVKSLPKILKQAGYRSAIVGDWAASDAEKFDFGFDLMDLPRDQWNIKYLLRQGPKDLRLFISLFTQNRFGKCLLPEVYYLGGIPLTEEVGTDTRRMIAKLASKDEPFFLFSFMATTHPPFTSKYPYYSMYSDPKYRGESKFIMAKLRDPWEIIRRQGEPKSEFDLDQIVDLYDGCVKNFDDEVARILEYLDASNLTQDTIVVIFSDHGFEFFEHETWGQGNSAIGDFSARVPIMIADPRNPKPGKVNQVVRTIDIAPTVLELAGLSVPGFMEGVSLHRLMKGENLEIELPAFYETGVWLTDLPGTPENHLRYPHLPELLEVPDKRIGMISLKPKYMDIIITAKDRMIRLGDWKLTYQPLMDGPLFQLFNIQEDPACQRNVIGHNTEIAAKLRGLLEEWIAADTRMAASVDGGRVRTSESYSLNPSEREAIR